MSKKYYNKLVRNKIPEIIEGKSNVKCNIKQIDGDELKEALKFKLLEETQEFVESDMDIEEMADIFEVISAILDYKDWTYDQIGQVQLDKAKERGGFEDCVYLISTEGLDD